MTEPQTCGRGLAENSTLPLTLGALTAALAGILETHMKSLDVDDEHALQEHRAYQRLVDQLEQAAPLLVAIGNEMAACRDLPMGQHDPRIAASPEAADAFERFVRMEEELLAQLAARVGQDCTMLDDMRGAGSR
jgi:hypothetical protein